MPREQKKYIQDYLDFEYFCLKMGCFVICGRHLLLLYKDEGAARLLCKICVSICTMFCSCGIYLSN